MRKFVCAVVALALCAGAGWTDDEKGKEKPNTVMGKIKKVDAKEGTVTVSVRGGKDVEFKISDDTKFLFLTGGKKEIVGAKGLEDDSVKEGTVVRIDWKEEGKATLIVVGGHKDNGKKDAPKDGEKKEGEKKEAPKDSK